MNHRILPVIALLALLAACSKPVPRADPVRAVKTVRVQAQSAQATQEFAGEVRAKTESRIGFRVGGKITRRDVDVGSAVAAGQALAQLDPKDLQLGHEAAAAGFVAARVNLEQAQADYRRFKDLLDKGFISAAELERRESVVKSAQAQFDQAKAQASAQGNQTGYATLVADASGVITGIDAEPGMVVAAGTTVLRLAHNGPRDVVFSVPEDQVAAIKALGATPGAFKVRLWGETAPAHAATLREIGAAADPVTRTFLVKADIGNIKGVRLGQTATVVVELPRVAGITKLPLSALREDLGKTSVWVVDETSMTVALRAVQVLGTHGNEVVIGAGVSPQQIVVTAGVHVLEPGQKVKLFAQPGAVAAATGSAAPAQRGTN
ncbi:MAG: efflux RND transporter periplasmic adaptor subunit [Burkholderiaceae bacterium]